MSELSAAPSDLDTPAASDESPRRRSAHTEGSMSSTGLMVRADLYDEEYSEDEYEQMLSMYEGTMASIAEGEIQYHGFARSMLFMANPGLVNGLFLYLNLFGAAPMY